MFLSNMSRTTEQQLPGKQSDESNFRLDRTVRATEAARDQRNRGTFVSRDQCRVVNHPNVGLT